jgi:hypothetical protein
MGLEGEGQEVEHESSILDDRKKALVFRGARGEQLFSTDGEGEWHLEVLEGEHPVEYAEKEIVASGSETDKNFQQKQVVVAKSWVELHYISSVRTDHANIGANHQHKLPYEPHVPGCPIDVHRCPDQD